MIAARAVVSGRVQGVGFRLAAARAAERLGLTGWVRNLPNGRVETVAQGDVGAVEAYVAWLEQGPGGAVVVRVERTAVEVEPSIDSFEVR